MRQYLFPMYFKRFDTFFKMLSNTEFVQVNIDYSDEAVVFAEVCHCEVPATAQRILNNGDRISENQFVDAFVTAVNAINDVVKRTHQQARKSAA